jgi:hypothetical protein
MSSTSVRLQAGLSAQSYWQLALFWAGVTGFYLLYSIHAVTVFEKETGRFDVVNNIPHASVCKH